MRIRRRPLLGLLALALSLGLSACEDKKSKDPGIAPEQGAVASKPVEKVVETPPAEEAEAVVASHPDCVGPRSTDPTETFEASGRTFERKGSTVTLKGSDPDDEFVIGQISDVKDFTPENKANLNVIIKWFKEKKVDAIALTGDIGESEESIANVIRHVAGSVEVPVLALAGNRECREHFKGALDKVTKDLKHVINMNHVRVFNTDDASFVSLPGYYNRSYIHCAEGCEYVPSDVDALEDLLKDASGPVKVLLSHGPPKQDGDKALDRIHEEVNVGDPKLTELLKKGGFPFGLFGNIQEAGGYGTNLAGDKRVEQGQFVDSLYVNPGPLDAVRWQMLDGTESLGMAALMKIKGKQASYEVYRIRSGEAKVAN
jgi:Icc-related predicted phosphoesterase